MFGDWAFRARLVHVAIIMSTGLVNGVRLPEFGIVNEIGNGEQFVAVYVCETPMLQLQLPQASAATAHVVRLIV
jgi:hypothetical protein